jgi:uncharacterized membrane protein YqjE
MSSSYTVPKAAGLALMVYLAGYFMVGFAVGAMWLLAPDYREELRDMIGWSAVVLLLGQLLCWRCGWEAYQIRRKQGEAASFVRVVIFAPITLWRKTVATSDGGTMGRCAGDEKPAGRG